MSRGLGDVYKRQELLASILQLFDARLAFLVRLNNQGKQFEVECLRGQEDDSITDSEKLALIVGICPPLRLELLAGNSVHLSADQSESIPAAIRDVIQEHDLQSILLKPVMGGESVGAVFGIIMRQPMQDITAAQVELMRIIALDLDGLIKGAQLLDRSQALAVTEERNSLARELHDSVTQILFSASMLAESIPLIWDKDQEIARMNIEKLSVLLREALAEMRSMLFELRSGDHQDQSLEELLTTLVDSAHARTQVVISLKVDDEPEPPEDVTQVFYRTAREALNNIIRHAEATQASISVLSEPNCAELRIKDNGRGFNPQEIDTGHMGIGIMSERVAEIGGNLQIQSTPGQGTMVVVTWSDNGVESIDNG